jgi:transposase
MAQRRKSVRKIKETIRLHEAGFNKKQIARLVLITRKTARKYIEKAESTGLSYAVMGRMTPKQIYTRLFPVRPEDELRSKPKPDWQIIYTEMKRKGMTLQLLWEEYIAIHPEGYRYSQFCHHYRQWKRKVDVSMRQDHKAGEKLFVDFAGQTVPVTNPATGQVRQAQIFIAVLGASNYTYAEATWTQALPDWIQCHVNAFSYLGGVTELVVPDNTKVGISKACRYEPDLNPTYHDFALHYGVAIMPTRVRRPKDKAKAENAVLVVERWILAALRNHTFFSLAELNERIRELLEKLNTRPFKKLEGSRKSHFEALDKPVLRPLPETAYEYAEWKKAAVNIDYHVEADSHYYSVPYKYRGEKVEIRLTSKTVSVYKDGCRISSHARSYRKGRHSMILAHLPQAHRQYKQWTPSRIVSWAKSLGENTGLVVEKIIERREHPVLGYRSSLGIIRLEKSYGRERLEAASTRAVALGAYSYQSIKSILKKGLEEKPLEAELDKSIPQDHENVRGSDYYQARKPC